MTAHRIPDAGWDVLEAPIPLKSASATVTKGSVTLQFPEFVAGDALSIDLVPACLLYTSPSPRDS